MYDICPMCGKVEESIDHLFLHCENAYVLWGHLISRCGIQWCMPSSLCTLVDAWRSSPFHGCSLMENYSFCYYLDCVEGKK